MAGITVSDSLPVYQQYQPIFCSYTSEENAGILLH
jgi:hypothetical protein